MRWRSGVDMPLLERIAPTLAFDPSDLGFVGVQGSSSDESGKDRRSQNGDGVTTPYQHRRVRREFRSDFFWGRVGVSK